MHKLFGLGALLCALALYMPAVAAPTPSISQDVAVCDPWTPTNCLMPATGGLGGILTTVTVAQTVTASSAYTSGNAVGGLMTLSGAFRSASGSGLIQSVIVNTKSAQTTAIDVVLFNANPSASTCTDKTAFAVAAADFNKIVGVAHVTDWTSDGTPSTGQAQNLAIPIAVGAGVTSFYACAVTRSTPTYAATTDVSVLFGIPQN